MADERLDFLLESRERISGDIGEVVGELRDLSSAASVGSRALGRLESQADDAGDELRSVASQAGVATTAVAGLDTALSRLDDVQVDVDVDVDSPPALDLDTTRRVALDVDRAELRAALNSMDDERIAINPVLRDFEATLVDAATAPESDLDVDRERTVTTRTENQLAAAGAQAALGDLGATVERAPDDVTIDVQTEGVTGTLDGLRAVRTQLADLDDEDARVSVELDADRSALDRLSDLDLGLAGDSISPDVDTGGERTVEIVTDMDVRGTVSHLRAVERALSRVDGRTATAEVETDIDTDLERTLHRAAGGFGTVSVPVEFDARQRVRDLLPDSFSRSVSTEIDETISGDVGTVVDSEDRTIRIGYDTDETRVLEDLATIHAELAALPDRKDININTEAELAALVRSIDGLESLPEHVRSEIDVEAHSTAAQGELSAVLAQAQTLDQIDPSVDVDSDGSALGTLRSRDAFGLDFDAPDLDMPGGDRGRNRGGFFSEAASGVGAVGRGAAGVSGIGGALSAASRLSGPALLGAGGILGGLTASIAGAVSAGIGAGVGASVLGAGIAAPIALSVDEREKQRLTENVQRSLEPLKQNIVFERMSDQALADIPTFIGMAVEEANELDDVLAGTFSTIRGSAYEELPEILDEASRAARVLDDDVEAIATGSIESVPGLLRETSRSANQLAPVGIDIARETGPVLGDLSRLGTGVIELTANSVVLPGMGLASAVSPIVGILGDIAGLLGDIVGAVYDLTGRRVYGTVEDLTSGAVGGIRDVTGLGGGGSAGGEDDSGRTPPPAPQVTVTDSAVASLPSQGETASTAGATAGTSTATTAGTATATPATAATPTASAMPVPSGGGSTGGDTYITNKYDVDIDNSGGGNITRGKVERWMRRFHMREHERARKQRGP